MAGLRQRQAEKRKAAILEAALHFFSERGYAASNVEDIAERAEVGIATIYKYFGAKGGLLREIIRPEIERLAVAGQSVLDRPPGSPADGVVALLGRYRVGNNWAQRDLLRALAGFNLGYGHVLGGLREQADDLVEGQVRKLLEGYEAMGKLQPGLDLKDMSAIIYGLFNRHFQHFISHDNVSFKRTRTDMNRQIALLFKPWVDG